MSDTDALPDFAPDREYILYIICLAKTEFHTPIKYVSDGVHEIYVFSRAPVFLPYLRKLMAQMVKLPSVRVILINQDMNILVDVLRVVLEKSVPELILERQKEYLVKFRENLVKLSGASVETGPDFHVTLPPGQADLPQAFDLVIVQNSDEIDEINYLSQEIAFAQQALRFIALKHGVRFGAVSGFSQLVKDTNSMVSLSNRLFLDSAGAEAPQNVIYKPEGSPVIGDICLHQFVPIGWDSWSKIMLVAKSLPSYSEKSKLLSSEVHIGELNDAYNEYFSGVVNDEKGQDSSVFSTGEGTDVAPESGAKESLADKKKRLLAYLTLEEPKKRVPDEEKCPFTYQELLKSLEEEQR